MTETHFFSWVDNVAARFARFFLIVSVSVGLWRMLGLAEEQNEIILLVFGWPAFIFAAILGTFQFGAVTDLLIERLVPDNHASALLQLFGGFIATLSLIGLILLCLMIFSITAAGLSDALGL